MTTKRRTALDEKLFRVHHLGRGPRDGALPRRTAGWDDYSRNERSRRLSGLDVTARHLLVAGWAGSVLPLFSHYRTDDRVEKAVNTIHRTILLEDATMSRLCAVTHDLGDLVSELRRAGNEVEETVLFFCARAAYYAALSTCWATGGESINRATEVAEEVADAVSAAASIGTYSDDRTSGRQAADRAWWWMYATYLRALGTGGRSFKREWASETAVAIARGISVDRAFDRMPVLADALEEAGCDRADELSALRGPDPGFTAADWWLRRLLYKPDDRKRAVIEPPERE